MDTFILRMSGSQHSDDQCFCFTELLISSRIDISDEFSFDHMLEFSKLAVAFVVELGGVEKKY